MKKLWIGCCLAFLMVSAVPLLAQEPCPSGLPVGTNCLQGQDEHGAFFLIAIPPNYNHRLVLWTHDFTLDPPKPLIAEKLGPAVFLLQLGYSVAASSFRPDAIGLSGWQVRDAAEDTENLRVRFGQLVGKPELTFVAGASEGGLITVEIVERFGGKADCKPNYDGAISLCGPVAGGRRNWDAAFDLRAVYQYYCKNLPLPSEPQYPLYFGLASNNTLSLTDVASRIDSCTGVLQPVANRTPQQSQNLANILNVVKITEDFLIIDMDFATFFLQELVLVRTNGLSPVTNLGVHYRGSTDDGALNAGVFRAGAHRDAAEFLKSAYDPTGKLDIPMVTMHTIGDGLAIVENENAYHRAVRDEFGLRNLEQYYTNSTEHCGLSNSELLASFQTLLNWVQSHQRPAHSAIVDLCEQNIAVFGDTCNFNLTFRPKPFDTRVPDRKHE